MESLQTIDNGLPSDINIDHFSYEQIWSPDYANTITQRFPDVNKCMLLRLCKRLYGEAWLNSLGTLTSSRICVSEMNTVNIVA